MKPWNPSAPRLHAMLEHVEGKSVLSMPRSDWSQVSQNTTNPVLMDVKQTPLASVASDASVIASVAHQESSYHGTISIYRHDPKDEPTPVNVDHYRVVTDLASNPKFPNMIQQASTEDNQNLRDYIKSNVFLVKQEPGPDHWLSEVPCEVRVMIEVASASSESAT